MITSCTYFSTNCGSTSNYHYSNYNYFRDLWSRALENIIIAVEKWRALLDAVCEPYQVPKEILPTRIFIGVKKFFRRNFQPRWSRLRWRSTT